MLEDVKVTRKDSPVQEGKVFQEPGVVEMADVKVALNQEHVLKQRAGGVSPVGHSFIQGAIRHILKKDHGLLHDGQHLLGPQVGLLKVTWNTGSSIHTEIPCPFIVQCIYFT